MKKKFLISVTSLFAMLMFIISCQKENREINPETDLNTSSAQKPNPEPEDKCRLVYSNYVDGSLTVFTDRYQYNSEGLLKDYKNDLFGNPYVYATMQYDKKGKLVTGGISYDGITYDKAVFKYQNDRIVKETYYAAGTSNVNDLVINTYNNKGQIIRREDPIYDQYTTFEYDAEGNNTKSEYRYLSDNSLIVRSVFHYGKHIKNPQTARPGMPPYNWWFINEVVGPFVPTEVDQYFGDGEGGEFLGYDEDPSKTIINHTTQNLALNRSSFDNIEGTVNYQYWEYENCGGKDDHASIAPMVPTSMNRVDQRSKDIALLRMPLLRGVSLQKQLAERKAILQRLKN